MYRQAGTQLFTHGSDDPPMVIIQYDCPFCGGRDTSDLKSCWDEDGAHVEVYQCVCGCRFSVTLEVLEHPSRRGYI